MMWCGVWCGVVCGNAKKSTTDIMRLRKEKNTTQGTALSQKFEGDRRK
jgi:hypothetical protein